MHRYSVYICSIHVLYIITLLETLFETTLLKGPIFNLPRICFTGCVFLLWELSRLSLTWMILLLCKEVMNTAVV